MEIFEQIIYQIGLSAAFVLGILCALHALLHKREPNSAVMWVSICITIPLVGSLLYIMFGANRIHRHAIKLMLHSRLKSGPDTLSSPSGQGPTTRFHTQDTGGEDKIYYPPESEQSSFTEKETTEFPMEVPAALLPARIRTMARIGYSVMGLPPILF